MTRNIKQPRYDVGDIIDLSYTSSNISTQSIGKLGSINLPDRIMINVVYKKSKSGGWMYYVRSEANNSNIYMSEDEIKNRSCKKNVKAYDNSVVIDLYNKGYRFCGNKPESIAKNLADAICCYRNIKHIVLTNAVFPNGDVSNSWLGIWVMYYNYIGSNDDNKIIIMK